MSQLEILAAFDDGDLSISAADLIARTGLPRSSVFRSLKLLTAAGFVHQASQSRRYTLGPRMLQLGMAARRQLTADSIMIGPLAGLVRQTTETVTFSLLDLPWRICAYVLEGPSELRQVAQVGMRYPLHLGAAGKVMLAHLDAELVESILVSERLSKPQIAAVTAQLAEFREQGYAITSGERTPGASTVAAPVMLDGRIYGSVAVVGPTERRDQLLERHQPLVVEVARTLSARVSERPSPDSKTAPRYRPTR
jgi:DNA-binding IclR family transcriptional regulator